MEFNKKSHQLDAIGDRSKAHFAKEGNADDPGFLVPVPHCGAISFG
jgi:hypothetical protein